MGHSVRDLESRLRRSYVESTRALVAAVEARDAFTHQHSARVERFSRCIARRVGMAGGEVECVGLAARLHDIGKIGIPDAILTKPGPLNREEFTVVKRHPAIGVEILRHSTHLHRELPLIRHHHERVDGLGYPHGLAGQRIPLGARVLAVADALDTMLSRRSYKPPYCLGRATLELTRGCDRQFDRDVVAAALAWLRDDGDATATSLHCGATQPSDCPNPQVACESACFQ